MAAKDKVFNTVELLEHILLQLPPEKVIQTGRVSKQWKKVIESSVNIVHHYTSQVLTPIRMEGQGRPSKQNPIYEKIRCFTTNPAIDDCLDIFVEGDSPIASISIDLDRLDIQSDSVKKQFYGLIVSPAVQSVQLLSTNKTSGSVRTIISNEKGIAVGHLINQKVQVNKFLETLAGRGFDTTGIEPSMTACYKVELTEMQWKKLRENQDIDSKMGNGDHQDGERGCDCHL